MGDCTSCDVGVCTPCAAGKASTTVGATSSSTCVSCAEGTFATYSGSTSCVGSPAGSYVTSNWTSSDGIGVTVNGIFSKPCPAGRYSPTRLSASCMACKVRRSRVVHVRTQATHSGSPSILIPTPILSLTSALTRNTSCLTIAPPSLHF